MDRQRLCLVSLLVIFALRSSLYSYPVSFTRLIQEKDGKILRVVDLIGEHHRAITQLTKKPSKRHMEFLTEEERKAFVRSERGLLVSLQKIQARLKKHPQEGKIALLWESPIVIQPIQASKSSLFIIYAGYQFTTTFKDDPYITVVASDTFRRVIDLFLMDLIYQSDLFFLLRTNARRCEKEPITFFWDPIRFNINNMIQNDMYKLSSKVSPDTFIELQLLWNNYKGAFTEFYNSFLEQPIARNETFYDLIYNLKGQKKFDLFKEQAVRIINWIMDLEVITNIFSLKQAHDVVYAGQFHTNHIAQMLVENMHFKKVIDIGIEFNVKIPFNINISLSADAWQFLEEDPLVSLRRYEKNQRQPYHHIIGPDFSTELPDAIRQGNKLRVDTLIKKGFKAHIDVTNIIIDEQSLLEIAKENNQASIVELLLQYGAQKI